MKNMENNNSKVLNIFNFISKNTIYFLVFIIPLFFSPWTIEILDFNKQALLIFLVFISLFSYMLKILVSCKAEIPNPKTYLPILIFVLIYIVSTFASVWKYGSFWGWPLSSSASLITILSFFLFYFIVSSSFNRKEIFKAIILFSISAFLTMLFGIFQLMGKFILPFSFSKTPSFNLIGSVAELGIFAAILLPLLIFLIIISRHFLKGIFIIITLASLFLLMLVNFQHCWWLVLIGSALVIILGAVKRDFFDSRWFVLPVLFLAIALFYIFIGFQFPKISPRPIEVFLSPKTSFDIIFNVLKENPFLGSGPGTFFYDFLRYKKLDFNQNIFWSFRFENSNSKIMDIFAETGIFGGFSFLVLIGTFLFFGTKAILKKTGFFLSEIEKNEFSLEKDKNELFVWNLTAGVFCSLVVTVISYLLFFSSLTVDFVFFFLLAVFNVLIFLSKKTISFSPSSLVSLIITFTFTFIFIFGAGIFILEGKRYIANVTYVSGLQYWNRRENEKAIRKFKLATRIDSKTDFYWREISQFYLQKINIEAVKKNQLKEEKEETAQKVQFLITNSMSSSKAAIDLNPKNPANWLIRGFVCQRLIKIVPGIENWAIDSYKKAMELEPTNPYFPTQIGIVLLKKAEMMGQEQKEEREKIFSEAREYFDKALFLKDNYGPARFQIAVLLQIQGKTDEAIDRMKELKKTMPDNINLMFQLALVYYQKNDYENARLELEEAIALNPNYSNALYFLSIIYDKQGKKNKAIEMVERILSLNPDNEEVKKVLENLKAGRKALEGIVDEITPIEEKPEEIKSENPSQFPKNSQK